MGQATTPYNSSTTDRARVITQGPTKIAPSPFRGVGRQLPVTEGSFRAGEHECEGAGQRQQQLQFGDAHGDFEPYERIPYQQICMDTSHQKDGQEKGKNPSGDVQRLAGLRESKTMRHECCHCPKDWPT